MTLSLPEYNADVYRNKGLSTWRSLYLEIADELHPESVVEFGAGNTAFLERLPDTVRRHAIDGVERFRDKFTSKGISYDVHDLNEPGYVSPEKFGMAICSDVFEHLLNPEQALDTIKSNLLPDGFLCAHVPNEYKLKPALGIILGLRTSVQFHTSCEEWNDPHLRRFTDIGFQRFLRLRFKHLIGVTLLRSGRAARLLDSISLPVPLFLRGGPTYLATDSANTAELLQQIKKRLGSTAARK